MKPNPLHMAMLAAMIGSTALVGCKKKEEPAPMPPVAETAPAPMPAPAPMAATASVNSVDLGNAVGADMRVTAPMSTFAPKDTLYAAVSTGTSDPAVRELFEKQIPMRRFGQLDEFASFAMAFLDGSSTFTTGQFVGYAGGWV